jgi:hypothetical protein
MNNVIIYGIDKERDYSMKMTIIKNNENKFIVLEVDEWLEYLVNDIETILNNKSKCILYTKSTKKLIRTIAMFLIKKDISKYMKITMIDYLTDDCRCYYRISLISLFRDDFGDETFDFRDESI